MGYGRSDAVIRRQRGTSAVGIDTGASQRQVYWVLVCGGRRAEAGGARPGAGAGRWPQPSKLGQAGPSQGPSRPVCFLRSRCRVAPGQSRLHGSKASRGCLSRSLGLGRPVGTWTWDLGRHSCSVVSCALRFAASDSRTVAQARIAARRTDSVKFRCRPKCGPGLSQVRAGLVPRPGWSQ